MGTKFQYQCEMQRLNVGTSSRQVANRPEWSFWISLLPIIQFYLKFVIEPLWIDRSSVMPTHRNKWLFVDDVFGEC